MQIKIDGGSVFVTEDDFRNLQESGAVFGNYIDFATASAVAMAHCGFEMLSEVIPQEKMESLLGHASPHPGKALVVSINWVDADEVNPDNL